MREVHILLQITDHGKRDLYTVVDDAKTVQHHWKVVMDGDSKCIIQYRKTVRTTQYASYMFFMNRIINSFEWMVHNTHDRATKKKLLIQLYQDTIAKEHIKYYIDDHSNECSAE